MSWVLCVTSPKADKEPGLLYSIGLTLTNVFTSAKSKRALNENMFHMDHDTDPAMPACNYSERYLATS